MKEIILSNIKLYVLNDYDELSAFAANKLAGVLRGKNDCVLGLATGESPLGMYKEITEMNKRGDVDFSGVSTFNLDEYYPIKRDNPHSFTHIMKENLFNHINIDIRNVHIPNGEAQNPITECAEYERKIIDSGGIDFTVLGLGLNGHIGFNEPSDVFCANTRYVALAESTIKANARSFPSIQDVPRNALSMGIKTIMMSRQILVIVTGSLKSRILKDAVLGPITPNVPASVLQLHTDVTIVTDQDAAKLF